MKMTNVLLTEWKMYEDQEVAQLVFEFDDHGPYGILLRKGEELKDLTQDILRMFNEFDELLSDQD